MENVIFTQAGFFFIYILQQNGVNCKIKDVNFEGKSDIFHLETPILTKILQLFTQFTSLFFAMKLTLYTQDRVVK